jgi:hypothetical protein
LSLARMSKRRPDCIFSRAARPHRRGRGIRSAMGAWPLPWPVANRRGNVNRPSQCFAIGDQRYAS